MYTPIMADTRRRRQHQSCAMLRKYQYHRKRSQMHWRRHSTSFFFFAALGVISIFKKEERESLTATTSVGSWSAYHLQSHSDFRFLTWDPDGHVRTSSPKLHDGKKMPCWQRVGVIKWSFLYALSYAPRRMNLLDALMIETAESPVLKC